jgi:hypothetical protein
MSSWLFYGEDDVCVYFGSEVINVECTVIAAALLADGWILFREQIVHYEILGRVVYDLLSTESEDYAAFERLGICAENTFDGEGGSCNSLELFVDILSNGGVTLLRLATNLSMFLQLTPFIFVAKLFYNLNK